MDAKNLTAVTTGDAGKINHAKPKARVDDKNVQNVDFLDIVNRLSASQTQGGKAVKTAKQTPMQKTAGTGTVSEDISEVKDSEFMGTLDEIISEYGAENLNADILMDLMSMYTTDSSVTNLISSQDPMQTVQSSLYSAVLDSTPILTTGGEMIDEIAEGYFDDLINVMGSSKALNRLLEVLGSVEDADDFARALQTISGITVTSEVNEVDQTVNALSEQLNLSKAVMTAKANIESAEQTAPDNIKKPAADIGQITPQGEPLESVRAAQPQQARPMPVQAELTESVQTAQVQQSEPVQTAQAQQTEPVQTAQAQQSEPVQTAQAQQTEPVQTTQAQQSEPVQTAQAQQSEPVQTAQAQQSEPVQTAQAQQSEPVQTTQAQQSEPVQTAQAQQTEPVQTAQVQQREPVQTAQAQQTEPVQTAQAQQSEPVQTAQAQQRHPVQTAQTQQPQPVQTTRASGAKAQPVKQAQQTQNQTADTPAADSAAQAMGFVDYGRGVTPEKVLTEGTPEERAVFDQTLDLLSRAITEERQLYTARLHPEGLGEVIIRMEKSSAGVVFDILATDEKTAQMINARLAQLQNGMTEYDARINPAVVTASSNAESMSGFGFDDFTGGFGGSRENAYSGNRQRAGTRYSEAGEDEREAKTTGYRTTDILNKTI